jgi:hypothetical protein
MCTSPTCRGGCNGDCDASAASNSWWWDLSFADPDTESSFLLEYTDSYAKPAADIAWYFILIYVTAPLQEFLVGRYYACVAKCIVAIVAYFNLRFFRSRYVLSGGSGRLRDTWDGWWFLSVGVYAWTIIASRAVMLDPLLREPQPSDSLPTITTFDTEVEVSEWILLRHIRVSVGISFLLLVVGHLRFKHAVPVLLVSNIVQLLLPLLSNVIWIDLHIDELPVSNWRFYVFTWCTGAYFSWKCYLRE